VRLERDLRDVVVVGSQLWVSTFRTAQILVVGAEGNLMTRGSLPGSFDFVGPFSPTVAWRMMSLPDGRVGVVHQRGLAAPVQTTTGGYGGGGGCGGIVEGAVTTLDSSLQAASTAVFNLVLPADLSMAPKSGQLALLSAGNAHTPGLAQVIEVPTSVVVPGPLPDMGPGEGGFDGGTGGGCTGGTPMPVTGEAIALAYDAQEHLWVQTREPATLQRTGFDVATTPIVIQLSTDSRADTGWAVFHSNSGASVTCASCHPEGGDDARTWEFAGIGPRRTQTLRGHVSGTEPFHWSGDLASFDALFGEVYLRRMAGPPLAPTQKQALRAWIDTIPLLPQSAPADVAAVARGKALFEDAAHVGCVGCHSGPERTNNASVDVNTGGRFQVARLVGVAWHAPFLHDGCAPTLSARFGNCGGGDAHGVTSQLTAAQIADLVAYLETL